MPKRQITFNVPPKTDGRRKGKYADIKQAINLLEPQPRNTVKDNQNNFRTPAQDEHDAKLIAQSAGKHGKSISTEWKVITLVEQDPVDRCWYTYVRKVWIDSPAKSDPPEQESFFDPGASGQ